uniref:Serpentine receptor class gamma n=1 Tax=Caenorhabditis japonica TaxID=281687 RepID=A0A8R1DP10_CAEJA
MFLCLKLLAFLYNFVMDSNVVTLVMSRIVQLSIPYTLIANSAEKLAMILGKDCESQFSLRFRVGVIVALLGTATALRINGLHLFFIDVDEKCDFFHKKWLSSHPEEQAKWTTFENVLTFFHTFVSFVLLCALNIVVVAKLRVQHRKTRRQSTSPAQLFSVFFRNFLGSDSITILTPVSANTTSQTLENRVLR